MAVLRAGAAVTYGYDANGELVCVTDAAGNQRGFKYDQVGNLLQLLSTCTGLGMVSGAAASLVPDTGEVATEMDATPAGDGDLNAANSDISGSTADSPAADQGPNVAP
jgi:YD repeat-containing protein